MSGDAGVSKLLDGLVLERAGFESQFPHRLRVCSKCLSSLRKNKMPKAAKTNGFWLGEFPEHLRDATFIEMIEAIPVRMSGMVLALEE